MIAGIYCKQTNAELEQTLQALFHSLEIHHFNIWIHPESKTLISNTLTLTDNFESLIVQGDKLPDNLDVLITIGGDGTFLSGLAATNFKNTPLLGINTGRLGFLADISPNEVQEAIQCLANGDYTIERRSLLETKTIGNNTQEPFPLALNELVVHKQDTSSMISIHTYINNEFLASYMADGLIIATPTGSTAYSMSAGGPIISPAANTLVITPIAPHNLTARPLVIPDNKILTLEIENRDQNYRLALDSNSFVIDNSAQLQVNISDNHCAIIKLAKHNFYKTIRNKLMWGVDKRI